MLHVITCQVAETASQSELMLCHHTRNDLLKLPAMQGHACLRLEKSKKGDTVERHSGSLCLKR